MNQLLLMCLIAGRRTAIPAVRVQSVIEIETITPIPRAPDFIVGLTALRSQALTVVDCRVSLGFSASDRVVGSRAAVIEHEGHRYALVVDEAFDVTEALSEPADLPGGFGEGWQHAGRGMVETESGPALLVDVEQLILGPLTASVAV
jgi:purine-binding chemotaxis protein CheW